MAKTKQQPSSGEDNKGSTFDPGDTTEGRDWINSATQGTVSDINWINHWKQMRARWHPDYLFGARHGARVYRYWDEDYMNSDYIVAVDADLEVPYYPYSYHMHNQSSSGTEKSEYHYGRDRRRFPWFCILLVIILGAAITIPVIFAIILSTSKPESPTDILGRIRSELTLVKIKYSPELANTSSPEFQFLVSEFEKEMGLLYDANVTKEQYAGSRVNSVTFDRKGSAKVSYDLFFDVKEMRIPTHETLKEILYSVDRDKRDIGLGVLGDLRFRIESYKVVDSKVIKRVDVNDTVSERQDVTVPSTKVNNVSDTESDSRHKHPVAAVKETDRFVPNIIVKKQPNVITHKIIVKTVKPVAKDWDKLRNKVEVKDSITTPHHGTPQTTTQDTPTARSNWSTSDATKTVPTDFATLTNTSRAQTIPTARPSSTTPTIPKTIDLVTDISTEQSTTAVFPESSSQETIKVERTTLASVTNQTTEIQATDNTRIESTIDDMYSSFTDPVSTSSDLTNLFVTNVTSHAQQTVTTGSQFSSTAPSEFKLHASLQPKTKTLHTAISLITHEQKISVTDQMKNTSITPIRNDDEEFQTTTKSRIQQAQEKTSFLATMPGPKSQGTFSAEPAFYSSTLSPGNDATIVVFSKQPVTNLTQLARTLGTQDIPSAEVFPESSDSDSARKSISATTHGPTTFSATVPSLEVHTSITTESAVDTPSLAQTSNSFTLPALTEIISKVPIVIPIELAGTNVAKDLTSAKVLPQKQATETDSAIKSPSAKPQELIVTEQMTSNKTRLNQFTAAESSTIVVETQTKNPALQKSYVDTSTTVSINRTSISTQSKYAVASSSSAAAQKDPVDFFITKSYVQTPVIVKQQKITSPQTTTISTSKTNFVYLEPNTGEKAIVPEGLFIPHSTSSLPYVTISERQATETKKPVSGTLPAKSTTYASIKDVISISPTRNSSRFSEALITTTDPSNGMSAEQRINITGQQKNTERSIRIASSTDSDDLGTSNQIDSKTTTSSSLTQLGAFSFPATTPMSLPFANLGQATDTREPNFTTEKSISIKSSQITNMGITLRIGENYETDSRSTSGFQEITSRFPANRAMSLPPLITSEEVPSDIFGEKMTDIESQSIAIRSTTKGAARTGSMNSKVSVPLLESRTSTETSSATATEQITTSESKWANTDNQTPLLVPSKTQNISTVPFASSSGAQTGILLGTIPATLSIINKSSTESQATSDSAATQTRLSQSLLTVTMPQNPSLLIQKINIPFQSTTAPPVGSAKNKISTTHLVSNLAKSTKTVARTFSTTPSTVVTTNGRFPFSKTTIFPSSIWTTIKRKAIAVNDFETQISTSTESFTSSTALLNTTTPQMSEVSLDPSQVSDVPATIKTETKTSVTDKGTATQILTETENKNNKPSKDATIIAALSFEVQTNSTKPLQSIISQQSFTSTTPSMSFETSLVSKSKTSALTASTSTSETPKDASVSSKGSAVSEMTFTNASQMTFMDRLTPMAIPSFIISQYKINPTTKDRMVNEAWLNFLKAILNIIYLFDGQNDAEIQKILLHSQPDSSRTENYITKDVDTSMYLLNLLMPILKIPPSFNDQNKYQARKILYALILGLLKAENLTNNEGETNISGFNLLKAMPNLKTPFYDRNYTETRDISFKLLSDLSRIGKLTAKDRDTITSKLNLLIAVFNLITSFDGQNLTKTRDILFPLLSGSSREGNLTIKDRETNMSRHNLLMAILNLVTSFDDQNKTEKRDMLFSLPNDLLREENQTTKEGEAEISRPNLRMAVINFITKFDSRNNTETADILFPLLFNLSRDENLTAKDGERNVSRIRLLTATLNMLSSLNGQNQTEKRDVLFQLLSDLSIVGNLTRNDRNTNTSILHQLIAIINLISPFDGLNNTETRDILSQLLSHLSWEGNLTAKDRERNLSTLHLLIAVLKLITPIDIQNKTETIDILSSLFANLAKDRNLTIKDRETNRSRISTLMAVINFLTPFDGRNDTETSDILSKLLSGLSSIGNLTIKEREMNSRRLHLLTAILNLITPINVQNDTEAKDMLFPILSYLTKVGNLTGQDRETNMSGLNLLLAVLNLITSFDGRNNQETRDLLFPLPTDAARERNQTIKDMNTIMSSFNLLMASTNLITQFEGRINTETRDKSFPLLSYLSREENLTAKDGEAKMSRIRLIEVIFNIFSLLNDQTNTETRDVLIQLLSDVSMVGNLTRNYRNANISVGNPLIAIINMISSLDGQNNTKTRDTLLPLSSHLVREGNVTAEVGERNMFRIRRLMAILKILSSLNVQNDTETRDIIFPLLSHLYRLETWTANDRKTNLSRLDLPMAVLKLITPIDIENQTETTDMLFSMFANLANYRNLTIKDRESNRSRPGLRALMAVINFLTRFGGRNDTETSHMLFQLLPRLSRIGNLTAKEREINTRRLNLLIAIFNLITPFDVQNDTEAKDMLFPILSNLTKVGNLTGQDRETNISGLNLLLTVLNLVTPFDGRNNQETRDLLFSLPTDFSREGNQAIKDMNSIMSRFNLLMAVSNLRTQFDGRNNTETRAISFPFLSDLSKEENLTAKNGEAKMSRIRLLKVILNILSSLNGQSRTETRDVLFQLLSDLSEIGDLAKNRYTNTSRVNLLTAILKMITPFDDRNLTETTGVLFSLLSDLSRAGNMTVKNGRTTMSRLRLLTAVLELILSLNSQNNTETTDILLPLLVDLPMVGNLTGQYGEMNISKLNLLMSILSLITRFHGRDSTETRDILLPLLPALSRVGNLTIKDGETNTSRLDVLMAIHNLMKHVDSRNDTEARDILFPLLSGSSREGNIGKNNQKTNISAIINLMLPFDERNSAEATNMSFQLLSDLSRKGNLTKNEGETDTSGLNLLIAILNLITTLNSRTTTENGDVLFPLLADLPRNLTTNDVEMSKSRLNLHSAIPNLITPFYGPNIKETRDPLFRSLSDLSKVINLTAKDGELDTSRLKLFTTILNMIPSFYGRNNTDTRNILFPFTPDLPGMENLMTKDGNMNTSTLEILTTILKSISSFDIRNSTDSKNKLFQFMPDLTRTETLITKDGIGNTSRVNQLLAILNSLSTLNGQNKTKIGDLLFPATPHLARTGIMTNTSRINPMHAIFNLLSSFNEKNDTEIRKILSKFMTSFSEEVENLSTKGGETNTSILNILTAIFNIISSDSRTSTEPGDILFKLTPVLSRKENITDKDEAVETARINLLMTIFNLISSSNGKNYTEPRDILFPQMSELSRAENFTSKDRMTSAPRLNLPTSILEFISSIDDRNKTGTRNILLQLNDVFRKERPNLTIDDEQTYNLLTTIFNMIPSLNDQNDTETRDMLFPLILDLSRGENLTNTSKLKLLMAILNLISLFDYRNNTETQNIVFLLMSDFLKAYNLIPKDEITKTPWINFLKTILRFMPSFDDLNNTETRNIFFPQTTDMFEAENPITKYGMTNTSWIKLLTAIINIKASFEGQNNTEAWNELVPLMPALSWSENLTQNGVVNTSSLSLLADAFNESSLFDGRNTTEVRNILFLILPKLYRAENLTTKDGVMNKASLKMLSTISNVFGGLNNTEIRNLLSQQTPDSYAITKDEITNMSILNLLTAIFSALPSDDSQRNTETRDILLQLRPDLSGAENLTTKKGKTSASNIKLLRAVLNIMSSFNDKNDTETKSQSFSLSTNLSVVENLIKKVRMTEALWIDLLIAIHNVISSFDGRNKTDPRYVFFPFTADSPRAENLANKGGMMNTSRLDLPTAVRSIIASFDGRNDTKTKNLSLLTDFLKAENLTAIDRKTNNPRLDLLTAILKMISSFDGQINTSLDGRKNTESSALLQLISDLSTAENLITKERAANTSRLDLLTSILNSITFDGRNNTETGNLLLLLMPDLSRAEPLVTKNEFANFPSGILDLISSLNGQNNTNIRDISFPLASDLSNVGNLRTKDVAANISMLNLLTHVLNLLSPFDGQNNTETRNISLLLTPDLFRTENPTRKDWETNTPWLNFYAAFINITSPFYGKNNTEIRNILLPLLSDLSRVEGVNTIDGMTNTSRLNLLRAIVNLTQSVDIGKNTEPNDLLFPLKSGLSGAEDPIRTDEEENTSRLNLPTTILNITSSFNTQNNTKKIDILFQPDLPIEQDNITNGEILKITKNGTLGGNTTLIVRSKTAKILNPSFEYLWSLGDNVLDTLLRSEKAFKTPDQAWDSDHLAGLNNSSVSRVGLSKNNRAQFHTINQDDIKPIDADILPDFDGSITGGGVAITIDQGFTTDFNSDMRTIRPFTIPEGRVNFTSSASGSSIGVPLSLGTPGLLSFPNTVTIFSKTTPRPIDTEAIFITQVPVKRENTPSSGFPTMFDLQIQSAETRRNASLMKRTASANVGVTAQPSNLRDELIPSIRDAASDMRSDNLLNLGGLDGMFGILGNSDKLLKDAAKTKIIRKNITSKVAVNTASTAGKISVLPVTKGSNPKDDIVKGARLINNDNFGFFDNFLNMNTNDILQPSENVQQIFMNQTNTTKDRGQASENVNSLLTNGGSNVVSNLLSPFDIGFVNEGNVPVLSEFSSNFDGDKKSISKDGPEPKINTSSLTESLAAFDISNILGMEMKNINQAKETNLTSRSNATEPDSNNTIFATSLENNGGKVGDETKLVIKESTASAKTTSTVHSMIHNIANDTNFTGIVKVNITKVNSTANIEATGLNGTSSKLELTAKLTGVPTEFRDNIVENVVNETSAVEEIDTSPANKENEVKLDIKATSNATSNLVKNNGVFSSESPELVSIISTSSVINLDSVDATIDGFRNASEDSEITSDTTVADATVVPIVGTSSWNNISIELTVQKNGTINGTSGERLTEMSVNSEVPELQFELSQRAFIGYPTTLQWKMYFIRGWKFIIVQKELQGSPPLIIGVVTEKSRIPSRGLSSLTISQDSVFGDDSAIIYLDIPSVVCDDEGTYTVRVLESPEIVLSERSDFVQVFDVPIVQAVVPDNLFESSKPVDPYCLASLGYPAGRLFLQIQYPTADRSETFMSLPVVENITLEEPCRKIVRVSFGEYLNDTINLNSTIIRCGVVDTPAIFNQDGVLFSTTKEINIIPDAVCGNSTTFTPHPFRTCNYIDCAIPEVVNCPQNTCFNSTSEICEPGNSLPVP